MYASTASRHQLGLYSPSRNAVIDLLDPETGLGLYSKKSPPDISAIFGPVQTMPVEDAYSLIEQASLSEPEEIPPEEAEAAFSRLTHYLLQARDGVHVCQLSEFRIGRVTKCYATRPGHPPLSWVDYASQQPEPLIAKANAYWRAREALHRT